jgi:hypothetical protein
VELVIVARFQQKLEYIDWFSKIPLHNIQLESGHQCLNSSVRTDGMT